MPKYNHSYVQTKNQNISTGHKYFLEMDGALQIVEVLRDISEEGQHIGFEVRDLVTEKVFVVGCTYSAHRLGRVFKLLDYKDPQDVLNMFE